MITSHDETTGEVEEAISYEPVNPTTESRLGSGSSRLAELLDQIQSCLSTPSASQKRLLESIRELSHRLATERFQLAVLGQFKRGKSTLLNALLGKSLLPTGVIPVTAIPTFLHAAGEIRLRVTHKDGRCEETESGGFDTLREQLVKLVTEAGNPNNVREIGRVDVFGPSSFLSRGVTLIDTPGVGSTYQHNTASAEAILPECDATLFVVSPDPPITALEIEYLAQIRKTVAHLTIILNKIDTVETQDQETAVSFLRHVLVEHAQFPKETPVFCLSAREAVRAQEVGNYEKLSASGFTKLESYLTQFLATKKRATLNQAIARKALSFVGDLRLETEIALKALRLPLHDLERKIDLFDTARRQFEIEQRAAIDLLAGDRTRALHELEDKAERLREESLTVLRDKVDDALGQSENLESARKSVTPAIVSFFENALSHTIDDLGKYIGGIFQTHQARSDKLLTLVRRTAANLFEIPMATDRAEETFVPRRDPFWVTTSRAVDLSPIQPGAIDHLLPAAIRKRRVRQRLFDEISAVARRNVENLRWATRQNLEDSFRSFAADLEEKLAASFEATEGAMKAAMTRRATSSEALQSELTGLQTSLDQLETIQESLRMVNDEIQIGAKE